MQQESINDKQTINYKLNDIIKWELVNLKKVISHKINKIDNILKSPTFSLDEDVSSLSRKNNYNNDQDILIQNPIDINGDIYIEDYQNINEQIPNLFDVRRLSSEDLSL